MLIKTEYTVIFKFKYVSTTVFLNSVSQLYMSTIHKIKMITKVNDRLKYINDINRSRKYMLI